MSLDRSEDVRKALLNLYSDNSLQFAGFGLGSIVAFVTELTGHSALNSLRLFNIPLFIPILLGTTVFVMSMFFRSAFWGRMTFVTVMDEYPEDPDDGADLMTWMYVFHIALTKERAPLATWIGNSALWWTVLAMSIAFAIGLLIPNGSFVVAD